MEVVIISFSKALVLSVIAAAGVSSVSAQMLRVEVMYVNGFSNLDPLVDADGVALTAGGPENDDGAIFQVGYFQNVSHLLSPSEFGEQEWSQFTPLTGQGSLNAERHPTTIGGIDSLATGPFGFLFYPSPVAIELDSTIDEGLPMGESVRFGVRFYNETTMENSTDYNIVTSNDALWMVAEPDFAPIMTATLDLDAHDLFWASGPDEAFQTSMSMIPEPGISVLGLLAGFFLLRRRRSPGRVAGRESNFILKGRRFR